MQLFSSQDFDVLTILQDNETFLLMTGYWKTHTEPVLVKIHRNIHAAERDILIAEWARRQQLVHPVLAQILEYGHTEAGEPYCIYEYPTGTSLAELPPRQVQELGFFMPLLADILEGLGYLHVHDMQHGAITSHAIRILENTGRPQLTDYGVSIYGQRETAELVQTAPAMGLPPEMIRRIIPDGRADLYALGATLYEVLTGRPVFDGEPLDILRSHLYKDVTALQQFLPRFPDALARFVHTLLEKDRALRFHTAEEALRFLAEYSLLPARSSNDEMQTRVALRVARPIGRDGLRSVVKSLLYDRTEAGFIELSGEHGLGKTTFLYTIAAELEAIGHVVQYTSLGGRIHHQTLENILDTGHGTSSRNRGIELPPIPVTAVKNKERIFIFDNTDDCTEKEKSAIQDFLAQAEDHDSSVRLVLTHRSQLPFIGKRNDVHTLPHLMPTHMQAVCRELLGHNELSEGFYRELYSGTNGHPLYIEEVLNYLIATGVLVRQHEVWRDVASIGMLPPLAALLAEKIGALPEPTRRVLGVLAIADMPLPLAMLADVAQVEIVSTLAIMYALLRDGYLTCRHGLFALSTRYYVDVILRGVPGDVIRQFKRALAGKCIQLDDESLLLYAAELLVEAGEPAEAIQHLTRLLEIPETIERMRAARMLHTIAQQNGDRTTLQYSCHLLADLYHEAGDLEREKLILKEWSDLLRDSADADQLAEVLSMLAQAEYADTAYARAYGYAVEAYRIFRDKNRQADALDIHYVVVHSLLQLKRWDEFITEVEAVIPALTGIGEKHKAATLALDAGYVYAKYLQNSNEAIVYYSTAQKLYSSMDDVRGMARALGNKGIVYLEHHMYDDALACFSEAAKLFKGIGDARGKLTALENIIQLHLLNQHYELAEQTALKALSVAESYEVHDEKNRIEKVLTHIRSKLQGPVESEDVISVPEKEVGQLLTEYLAGRSTAIRRTREQVQLAVSNESPVLLEAPFGTGKEFVARKIHAMSARASFPLGILHSAGSTTEELEQNVFGLGVPDREQDNTLSLLAECNNGVVYIDDVLNLPAQFQSKLAYFIEHGEVPGGRSSARKWNIRIIAGCTLPAEQALAAGTLQHDLFFQLSINRIALPRLDERREDIPALVGFLLEKYSRKLGKTIEKATPKLLQKLMQRQWTGDVRELENIVHRLMIREQSTVLQYDSSLVDTPTLVAPPGKTVPIEAETVVGQQGSMTTIDDIQKDHILRVLSQTKNNKSKAAKMLGIKRTTLLARMKKLGLMP